MRRLAATGRVDLLWGTEVMAIDPGRVHLRSTTGASTTFSPGIHLLSYVAGP